MAAGYAIEPAITPRKLILNYFNTRRLRISIKPRRVNLSREIHVPSQHNEGFKLICESSKRGISLMPHQSDRILNPALNDKLLNDWNIYHLHLGATPDLNKKGFMGRTSALLYLMISEEDVYCIDVMSHRDFSKQRLLSIVHNNWPHLLEGWKLNSVMAGQNISDDDLQKMRKINVNTSIKMDDGTLYYAPGGGYASDGTSLQVVMQANRLYRDCQHLMDLTISNLKTFVDEYHKKFVFLSMPFHFHLQIIRGEAFAREQNSGAMLRLKFPLDMPGIL